MTDNQILALMKSRLEEVADDVKATREATQDTRERLIRLEEQRGYTLERLSRAEGQVAAFGIELDKAVEEVAELRGAGRKLTAIGSTIASAIAGAVALLAQRWGSQ